MAFGDPTLAGGERAIGGAVQHDIEDGIDGAVGERLSPGNKVTGSIVDQHIERSVGEGGIHQAVDSFRRANVNDMGSNLAGQRVFELFRGILQDLGPAAANHQLGAELDHAPAHGLAEPGAAAGDQHAFSLEKIRLKHVASPCSLCAPLEGFACEATSSSKSSTAKPTVLPGRSTRSARSKCKELDQWMRSFAPFHSDARPR